MEQTEPENEPNEQPKAAGKIETKPHLKWYTRLFMGLIFGICSLLITNLFDRLGKPEDIVALENYQTQITTSLNRLSPLQLYHLYVAALGFEDVGDWKQSDTFRKELSRCQTVGDNALRDYLNFHPGSGIAVATDNHRYYCQSIAKPELPAQSGLAPGALEIQLWTQLSLEPNGCLKADAAATAAYNSCYRSITPPVGHWTRLWTDWFSWTRSKAGIIQLMPMAFVPVIALADVIWHNFLVFNSVAVVHWALLALGLWVAHKTIPLSKEIGFQGSLLAIALFPLLTVLVASFTSGFLYLLALGGLWLFRGVTQLALYPLAGTSAFFYLASLKSLEHSVIRKIEQFLEWVFEYLFAKITELTGKLARVFKY